MIATALLLGLVASLDATQPLSITVSPAQSFAPTTLTIRVRVEPDDTNRALDVVTEGGSYYRSSRIPLDGADAPRTIALQMRNVPGGEYEVRGSLTNTAGR
jgi:hypothetical protein